MLAKPIERIKIKNDKVIEGKLLLYKLVSNDKNERLPVLAKSKTLASVPIDTTDFSMSGINLPRIFITIIVILLWIIMIITMED